MKIWLSILSLIVFGTFGLGQDEPTIVHQGHYRNENLYLQNPYSGSGVGFCVKKVFVNDSIYNGDINSSAFEIDFTRFGLKEGDEITVKIVHRSDCLPKVLNPRPIHPKCSFEIVEIKIENDTLKWTTKNEHFRMTYIIEQYRWNKWIKVGEKFGDGFVTIENNYSFHIETHSGINKFRVKQIDYSGKPCISTSVTTSANVKNINYTVFGERIEFSDSTMFELFDSPGNLIKKGNNNFIDISDLHKGLYYLNFDNLTGEVINLKK